jgi:hypothetical protein
MNLNLCLGINFIFSNFAFLEEYFIFSIKKKTNSESSIASEHSPHGEGLYQYAGVPYIRR